MIKIVIIACLTLLTSFGYSQYLKEDTKYVSKLIYDGYTVKGTKIGEENETYIKEITKNYLLIVTLSREDTKEIRKTRNKDVKMNEDDYKWIEEVYDNDFKKFKIYAPGKVFVDVEVYRQAVYFNILTWRYIVRFYVTIKTMLK